MDREIASGFEKAFALVAVNEYDKDIEAYLKTLLNLMRIEYGFTAEQLIEFSNYDGVDEDDTNGDGIEDDSKPSSKFKEIIDFENFQADLVDIDELYNDGKLSKMEYLKHKARLALNLTTAE